MVLSSSKADAQTTSCGTELDALARAISSATTFTNSNKDQQNLLHKVVQEARKKLDEGKTADAILKIRDIQLAVEKPVAVGKLGLADAAAIQGAAADAITCLTTPSA